MRIKHTLTIVTADKALEKRIDELFDSILIDMTTNYKSHQQAKED